MSTRAIIGVLKEDDTVIGLWQWNDGDGLLPLLRNNFKSLEDIEPLLKLGVINLLCDKEGEEYLVNWQKENRLNNQGTWYRFGEAYVYQSNDYRGSKPTLYRNVKEAAGQDINFLYLFDIKNFTWSVIR